MTSFISALSLLLLVLASSCLTLPVDQALSFPLFNNDSTTTDHPLHLRLVPDEETSSLPNLDVKHPLDSHVNTENSTLVNHLLQDNVVRASRKFDEFFTTTTEESDNDKDSSTTVESVEESDNDKHSSTTVEPTTRDSGLEIRGLTPEFENTTQLKIGQDEIKVESTTLDMSTSTTSSSTVAPVSTSTLETSTKKYIGLLQENLEDEEPKKYIKKERKLTSTTPKDIDGQTDDSSKIPIAVFDQSAFTRLSNVPSDTLILDEKNDVVTDLPTKYSTTTKENKEEKPLLNQGKKPSHVEEKKSDN